MIIGLGTRTFPRYIPGEIFLYLGDILWALCVYLFIAIIFPRFSTLKVFLITIIFAYLVEISQLYSAPWIDNIRANKLVALVLGYGFQWKDLFSYAVGAVLGTIFDMIYRKLSNRESSSYIM